MDNILRVETLTSSLKQARNAKESLENRLQERRNKRKELESVYENANSKLTQVKELQSKMMDTMKMAQHKVSQTQAFCDSLEGSNKEKRDCLQKLEGQINEEESGRMNDAQQLKDSLSRLSKTMIDARKFYVDDNLKTAVQEAQEEFENHSREETCLEHEERELEKYLTSLVDQQSDDMLDIDRQVVWDLFLGHQQSLLKNLQEVEQELQLRLQTVPVQG